MIVDGERIHASASPRALHDDRIDVRALEPRDIPQVVRLMQLGLGENALPRSAEAWDWKHARNPFGKTACLVAVVDDQVIALRTFLRWRWAWQGRDVQAVRAVDTVTHPSWRARGLFRRLTTRLVEQMRDERIEFIFNTPNASSRPGNLSMGWRVVAELPLWVRPLRVRRPLLTLGSLDPYSYDVPLDELYGAADALPHLASHELERFAQDDPRFRTRRTLEYLQWRYVDVPGPRYASYFRPDAPRDGVFIVRGRRRRALREAVLEELWIAPGVRGFVRARRLLGELLARLDVDYVLSIAPTRSREAMLLASQGFVLVPRAGPVFTVRDLGTPAGQAALAWQSWALSAGALELF